LCFSTNPQRQSTVVGVLWTQASHGPERTALSHETALLVFGLSDVNPAKVHLTVPKRARLRREKPSWIVIHRADLPPHDLTENEGVPVTTVERTITDVLTSTHRSDLARQAIADARREGYLDKQQEARLRRALTHYSHNLAREVTNHKAIDSESKAS
jgi:predicted transcriptional regulator of viral defense system